MKIEFQDILPGDIERHSFAIITRELGARTFSPEIGAVVKRVIHTTADFDYADTLCFSPDAVEAGVAAFRGGCTLVTDTQMALAGISKPSLKKLGCTAVCYMADPDVAVAARQNATTRAVASMEKAAALKGPVVYALGNAPTALIRLCEQMESGLVHPALVIGVPVGFVNAAESKELLLRRKVPHIVARGRKGGSTVAAAICNALLYLATGRTV